MNCLNCGKELQMTEGRRPKVYCDARCRVAHFKKRNKKDEIPAKYVLKERYDKLKDEVLKLQSRINALEAQISAQGRSQVNHHKELEMPPDQAKSISTPIKPLRMEGESGIDYSIRLAQWKDSLKNQ